MIRVGRFASIAVLLALAGVLVVTAGAKQRPVSGTVVGVVAGDTLRVRLAGGAVEQVRVLGVRAPGGCFAAGSAAATRRAALGKRVLLRAERGFAGSYVALPGGADLGRLLLARGAALVDVWGTRFSRLSAYVPVQQEAQKAVAGMWRACAADISLTMSGPDNAVVGKKVTYTIVAKNTGPLTARHIFLELRSSATLASADSPDATCAAKGWFASCSIDAARPGGSATVTLVLEPARPGTLSVHGDVSLDGCIAARCGTAPLHDPNLENDEAAALTLVAAGDGPATRVCDPGYPTICIPPPPPDLDCAEIVPLKKFRVLHDIPNADDHHLDGNNDGIGCQFDDY